MSTTRTAGRLACLALVSACTVAAPEAGQEEAGAGETEQVALPPTRIQLDSGNAAYRAKQYEAARVHYTRATELDPSSSPAWFGVYMAETALGNSEAAAAAMAKARELGPAASAHHPPPADSTTASPHPIRPAPAPVKS